MNSNKKILIGIGILIKFVSQILVKYRNFPNSTILVVIGIVLISGCTNINPKIFEVVTASGVSPTKNIAMAKPINITSEFIEGSEVYVCARITASTARSCYNAKLYYPSQTKTITISGSCTESENVWACINVTEQTGELKSGKYRAEFILEDKVRDVSFEVVWRQITKEHAIAIANATEEVQEFLKLYPDTTLLVSGPWGKDCEGCPQYWGLEYSSKEPKLDESITIQINTTKNTTKSDVFRIANNTKKAQEFLDKYSDAHIKTAGPKCLRDEDLCFWNVFYIKEYPKPETFVVTIDIETGEVYFPGG